MGMTRHDHDDGCMIQMTHQGNEVVLVASMKYHTSWDWLMPVVEKIEQVNEGVPQQMLHVNLYSEIGEVYTAVVNFIKAYNYER